MPLMHVAVLAVISGLAEALAVSPSGHVAVARIFLDAGAVPAPLQAMIALGTMLGLLAAASRRLGSALGEGVRAVARPALFATSLGAHDARTLAIGIGASLTVSTFTWPRVESWAGSPTATGMGLLATGLALASTRFVPRFPSLSSPSGRKAPSLVGAALVGIAHGLAVFPGASRVGAALTVLLWIGVLPLRAIDLAFLLTAPSLFVVLVRSAAAGPSVGTLALAVGLSFVGTWIAAGVLRAIALRRRFGALALWMLPLGLATLAYSRAY